MLRWPANVGRVTIPSTCLGRLLVVLGPCSNRLSIRAEIGEYRCRQLCRWNAKMRRGGWNSLSSQSRKLHICEFLKFARLSGSTNRLPSSMQLFGNIPLNLLRLLAIVVLGLLCVHQVLQVHFGELLCDIHRARFLWHV